MNRNYRFWVLLIALILLGAFASNTRSAGAQTGTPEPTATPQPENVGTVTLQDLGFADVEEIELSGYRSSGEQSFYLPYGWVPDRGTVMNLDVRYALLSNQAASPGVLQVWINNKLGGSLDLAQVTSQGGVASINVAPQVWATRAMHGRHTVRLKLLTAQNCVDDVRAYISTATSTLDLAYHLDPTPEFTFDTYPQVFVGNPFQQTPVLFVLPGTPSLTELRTASAVAARLGRLGANPRAIRTIKDTEFDANVHGEASLIVIGSPGTNSLLSHVAGGHQNEVQAGVGMLHMQTSPWNRQRGVIVVSGGDDQGIELAGRALASSESVSTLTGTHAVITELPTDNVLPDRPPSGTLRDLGYASVTRGGSTNAEIRFDFDLPDGYGIQPDGFIELHFAHASPLLQGASALSVYVNDTAIGSVELSEANSENGMHRFALPNDLSVWRGNNIIRVRAQMVPALQGDCAANAYLIGDDWPWVTIYDSSIISLVAEPNRGPNIGLDDFPRPFEESAGLNNTIFILPESPEAGTLDAFLKLSSRLGSRAREATYFPVVMLGAVEEIPEGATVIAIGRPSTNSYITGLNASLPQPFQEGTDRVMQAGNQAAFALPENYGVAQLLTWENNVANTTLIVSGTSEDSIRLAADDLTDPGPASVLMGNLAYFRADQPVVAFDSRGPSSRNGVTPGSNPNVQAAPNAQTGATSPETGMAGLEGGVQPPIGDPRPLWAIPVVVAAASAVLGMILIIAYARNRAALRRNRRP